MRRIQLVTVAVVMAAMLALNASVAFAVPTGGVPHFHGPFFCDPGFKGTAPSPNAAEACSAIA
jgi:hypothetical protein